jgi:uncharacterized protein (TIGR00255 family)
MSVRSMTGFARVSKTFGDSEVTVTVKSVNHRGLDVHFRMPAELDALENVLRAAVKRRVNRGHIQVQARYVVAAAESPASVNQPLLEAYLNAFHRAAAIHGLTGQPDLNAALRIPGMFEAAEREPDEELQRRMVETLEEALDMLNQFREREGAEIAAEMRARTRTVLVTAKQIEDIRGRVLPELQARLNTKLAELLGANIDLQRLAQEAAFLADRSDIAEEITRLKVHAVQLDDLLAGGGEVGKKLDFLLQEMHRETNTILSKSTGAGDSGLEITDLALTAKSEIEKIREQGLNLE